MGGLSTNTEEEARISLADMWPSLTTLCRRSVTHDVTTKFLPLLKRGRIYSLVKRAQFYISPIERLHFHTLQPVWATKSSTLRRFGSLTILLRFGDLWQRLFSAWRSRRVVRCPYIRRHFARFEHSLYL